MRPNASIKNYYVSSGSWAPIPILPAENNIEIDDANHLMVDDRVLTAKERNRVGREIGQLEMKPFGSPSGKNPGFVNKR